MHSINRLFILGFLVLAALAACSSEHKSKVQPATPDSADTLTPKTLSGTVAAGAALAGPVRIKDANGNVVEGTADAQGHFTLTFSGLTPPLVLQAEGRLGSRPFLLHSAAVAADLDGTVNITPLTDLIVANIAKQPAMAFYDDGDFRVITPTKLRTQEKLLRARLADLLSGAGVATDFDFLKTAFPADHTGFDAVLDMLSVRIDTANNKATIVNVLSNHSIVEDFLVDTETDKLVNDTDILHQIGDLNKIVALIDTLGALFQMQNPVADDAALLALFAGDFVHNSLTPSKFIADWLAQDLTGAEFVLARIINLDIENGLAGIQIEITQNGDGFKENVPLKRNTSGQWQFFGNQYVAYIELSGEIIKHINYDVADQSQTNSLLSGLHYFIDTAGNPEIIKALITGPGLSSAKILIACTGSTVLAESCDTPEDMIVLTDDTIAALPDNPQYTVVFSDNQSHAYTQTITIAKPHSTRQPPAFPSLISPTLAALGNYGGGSPLNISATLPAEQQAEAVEMSYYSNVDGFYSARFDIAQNPAGFNASLQLDAKADIVETGIILTALDTAGRIIKTDYETFKTHILTGTVSVGTTLSGTVLVKDSAGNIEESVVDAQGRFFLDVTLMTPPFVLQADVRSGARSYLLHSAATAADIGGYINITPLTNLIVANTARQTPAAYFDGGDYSLVTAQNLSVQESLLQARLQDLLTELGVANGVDFLRTAFDSNNSGMDALLDVIRVDIDDQSQSAIIHNVLAGQSITDTFLVDTDVEKLATTGTIAAEIGDFNAIKAGVDALGVLFQLQAPAAANPALVNLFAPDFLHATRNYAAYINQLLSVSLVNAEASLVQVTELNVAQGTAIVEFELYTTDQYFSDIVPMVRNADGVWQWYGDQFILPMELTAKIVKTVTVNAADLSQPVTTIQSGIHYYINDIAHIDASHNVMKAVLEGPGISNNRGVLLRCDGGTLLSNDCTTSNDFIEISDAAIAQMPDRPVYTLSLYEAGDVLQSVSHPSIPVPQQAGATTAIPELTAPTLPALAVYDGGSALPITATLPAGLYAETVVLYHSYGEFIYDSIRADFVLNRSAFDTALSLDAQPDIYENGIELLATDALGRFVKSAYHVNR